MILCRDASAPPFNDRFSYRAVMGKFIFLEKSTIPNPAYATHHCARFYHDPRASHKDSIIQLVDNFKATRTHGIMLDPEGDKSFKVYANAHFFGNWHRPTSGNDLSTAKIRTGYAILYAGCPIIC